MKLIIAITNKDDSKTLNESLSSANYSATKLESFGGFLGNQGITFLIGTKDKKVEEVKQLIKHCCKSKNEKLSPVPQDIEPGEFVIPEAATVRTAGAIVFVLEVSEFLKL